MEYFLPGMARSLPFVVIPELFMRKKFVDCADMQLELESCERLGAADVEIDRRHQSVIDDLRALESLPDALFASDLGSFFLEVELSGKAIDSEKASSYKKIFEVLKQTNSFLLYLVKDKAREEYTFNNFEWTCFSASVGAEAEIEKQRTTGRVECDARAERVLARYGRYLQENQFNLGDRSLDDEERRVSNRAIDEFHCDPSLRRHLAFIRVDRPTFDADRREATSRLSAHLLSTTSARKGEVLRLYERLQGLFLSSPIKAPARKQISRLPSLVESKLEPAMPL